MSLFLIVAAQTLAFSCTVDPPRNLLINGEAALKPITLSDGPGQWKFDLTLRDSDGTVTVALDWPNDPISAGKAVAGTPEGPHDYAFMSFDPGPCLFTVTSCMTMYTLSQQTDGTADILVQPSALWTIGDRSRPAQAFMAGRCAPKKAG